MHPTQPTDEIEVEFERYGDGQPLLLLHGGMAPAEYWGPVIPAFGGYGAVVPQRPGFGTCLDSPAETSADEVLDREVRYVQALIDAVDDDPILFGHSYGALTAIEAASVTSVKAVIAYEPAVLPAEYRTDADLADRMASLVQDGEREEAVKRYIEQVLHPDGIEDLDAWLAEWPVWPDCVDLVEEVVRMNRSVEQYRLPDRLAVDTPTLVLSGTDGPGFLRQSARDVHDTLPQSRFVEFDGVSHSGPAEAPNLIAAEVDAFLQD